MEEIQPDYLENYMGLGTQEITRLVLSLLIEETIKKQLTPFRQVSGSKDQVTPLQSNCNSLKPQKRGSGSTIFPVHL